MSPRSQNEVQIYLPNQVKKKQPHTYAKTTKNRIIFPLVIEKG